MQARKPSLLQHPKGNDKKRIRLGVYLVCVIMASFFWLMIKMSQEYTIKFTIPIEFTDVPAEYTVGGSSVDNIETYVTAPGFVLFALRYGKLIKTVEISLKTVPYRKINQTEYFISSGVLKELIANGVGLSEDNFRLDDDQLVFRLEKLSTATVAVKAVTDISYRQQFGSFGVIGIEPAMVTVFGPSEVLDTLQSVYTKTIAGTDIHQTIITSVSLNLPGGLIQTNTGEVKVTIPVEQFTESSILVNISVPEYVRRIKTFPDKAEVFFLVPMKEFMKIHPDLFHILLDTSGLAHRKQLLQIVLEKHPEQVIVTQIQPSGVEYLFVDK
jgi:hypothetical protein